MAVSLKPLSEQTIVITGASSGIGLATAQMAVDKGAKVVLAARNSEALDEIVVGINNRGGKAVAIDADVADEDAAERIADKAIEAFGGFDTWVNNAAVALYARLEEVSIAEHRRMFDVGYFGLVQGSLEAVRHLKTKGGAIINIGSVLSDRAIPIQGAYSAMKHAVRGFTDALRMELEMEGANISVTLIKPNGMDTPYPEHARNKMGKPARIPPVVYDPRLVAKAICFAAENPKRSLTVGGGGLLVSALPNLMPRSADKGMETLLDEKGQTSDTLPAPGTNDNLFTEKVDGRIDSNQDLNVRRSSLYLEAQMRPLTTAAIVGGAAAAAAGAYMFATRKRKLNGAMQAALTAKEVSGRESVVREVQDAEEGVVSDAAAPTEAKVPEREVEAHPS